MNLANNPLDQLLSSFLNVGMGILRDHWPLLLFLGAITLLARILRKSLVKGFVGEAVVNFGALRKLEKEGYRVFNDIVLPRPDGKGTTQIDHIIASPTGIFVIETKNYAGWIFGDEHSRYWTQTLRGQKNRFQNPLHQNALHINALAKATGLPKERFKSLVYFIGDATLKTKLPPEVMTTGLASYVRKNQALAVSNDELATLISFLESLHPSRAASKKAHRIQIEARNQP